MMLGLDANILIRYLMQDDRRQFEKARRLIHREAGKGDPVFIGTLVLLEIEWVLRSRHGSSKVESPIGLPRHGDFRRQSRSSSPRAVSPSFTRCR
jgi:predicted nucleic acid-binding protein